ncbi:MAG: PilZ domain-containing protein [Candidatus Thiodiazotropha sp. (ex Ctena orbiculata)]|uniref:PilZ domain-containing protein n=1 Tax=Candidatus Thiodiazotropha taylori TaxID=2792791 RepID=A0A944QUD1_9GAMM|nr:PilZ domain-containing protein [Candidatus Thiodiazotropha taylori]PUB85527.1 MAG: adenylate cyclase [gamma proteobacterium symbiont of Ctena orbiculata]MBT2990948.1 PilZ domain-containing protein [Candidatus Thiodiazotropha taylori]MBT2998671.1 PilZ domain-containing protein [Candidatus Thiodiazotropha taylori]MBT3002785.1 PilZ domain-containing protein [Candidatus Thiodiazotropha taylori]
MKHAEEIERIIDTVGKTLDGQLSPTDRSRLHQALIKSLDETPKGGYKPQYKQVTILLSDLRGFTSIAERYPPDTIINILNYYFSRMCEIIFRFGGSIDKFMGDSIMALFGLTEQREDDLERAIACAVEMQRAMLEINSENSKHGYPRLFMGIGINSGEVVAGHLGSELHHEYTVIGDEVNLASRIEAYSLRGQILLSEHSRELADSYIETSPPNRVLVKGKQVPVSLYELLSTKRPRYLEVPRVESRRSPRIEVDFPIAFHPLQNKIVSDESFSGRAVDLSYNGLQADLPVELEILSDIRITLYASMMSEQSSHIYAKILDCEKHENSWLSRMEFTGIDETGQAAIKNYIDQAIGRH